MSKKISSFIEFWQAVKSISFADDEILLFRGHANCAYRLQPSIFRDKCNKKNEEQRQYHEILIEYPEEFKKRSHLSNLVKMQHYGVSTRLLDFTRNPLISLLVASEPSDFDGEVIIVKVKKSEILHHNSDRALMLSCIPCFDDDKQEAMRKFCMAHNGRITEQYIQSYDNVMHKFLHEIRGEYPGFECEMIGEDLLKGYFVAPVKDNERMKLQNGLFYIFGLDEEPLDDKMDFERILIDKRAKRELLNDLELMDISNANMYSGFERKAMNIKGKYVSWKEDR